MAKLIMWNLMTLDGFVAPGHVATVVGTRPFEFITLNGKLTMYARKDATDQLRKLNAVTAAVCTGGRRWRCS